ncbi:class I SAM-dependent methyltransferase [Actinomadura barringtoniae]|nr:class I SAM-dependent methyltransferase [Actinomadura barringtoniae]
MAAQEHRVRLAALFDAQIRPHNARFRAAARIGPRDRVLDVGCGTGQSTREAAARTEGDVLGVDISAQSVAKARELSADLPNVAYLEADAQSHAFLRGHYDLCVSRLGTMFFSDPVAAFTNIASALRRAARLVLLVWQDGVSNEWSYAVRRAINAAEPVPVTTGPFALSDPATVNGLLNASGFTGIDFTDVHEPVYYGPDVATAYDLATGLKGTQDVLATAPDPERALDRLRATITAHDTGHGVYFDSRAWIITAQRA